MPHTRTVRDMGTLYAFPIHIQGMSAIRIPQFRKLPHFQIRTAKTLSICLLFYLNSTTNLKIISQMSNYLR
jgi:hypothetical protein